MRFSLVRFINIFILACVGMLTLTGVYGLFWTFNGWLFDLHRYSGWALVAAIPWKTITSLPSLRRGLRSDFDRGVMLVISLLLTALSLLVLVLGLAWAWRVGPSQLWLRQTSVSWHWMLGLGLLAPFALHIWRRWPRPKKVDFTSRRAALKMLGLGSAGLAGWWAASLLSASRSLPDAPRRISGSRLDGLFTGNRFPVTQTVAYGQVDLSTWRLAVGGEVADPLTMTYNDLLALPAASKIANLDCTLGWYTTQSWYGLPLADLLEQAGASPRAFGVRLESLTGYSCILPMMEARQALLATHVGDEVLDPVHGFPLRAVVPTRRGWFWVKWLSQIKVVNL